jgi:hypothetical protein
MGTCPIIETFGGLKMETRIKISAKDLLELIRNGKTKCKYDLQIEEVEYDPETETYVTTRFGDVIDFIEVEK